MPWFFSYGIGTDLEQTKLDLGHWQRHQASSLKDHVYTFTGYHPDFKGATSTILPCKGGIVLGVAYLIEDQQVQDLVEHGHGYVLKTNQAMIGDEEVPVLTLQPAEIGAPDAPSEDYVQRVRNGLNQHYGSELVEVYLSRALKRAHGQELIDIKSPVPSSFTQEYGCDFRRLYPWKKSSFGGAWAILDVGKATLPHCHDEQETFIFVNGEGLMSIDGKEFPVRKGDAVYLEPFSPHTVLNTGDIPLEILCVWWGALIPETAPEATAGTTSER